MKANERFVILGCLALAMGATAILGFGCDTGSNGGGSGGSGATSSSSGGDAGVCPPVIGALLGTHGDAHRMFEEACCLEQNGVLGDRCEFGTGSLSHCFAKPPAPSEGQFSCLGVMNCMVGDVCVLWDTIADGCARTMCREPMPGCKDTPTCACFYTYANVPCTEDAAGNPHVHVIDYHNKMDGEWWATSFAATSSSSSSSGGSAGGAGGAGGEGGAGGAGGTP